MAGGQERILRRRIRSVQSTKKITRAFELIAASQIVRAQARLAGSRPYVEGIGRVLAVTASEAAGAGGLGAVQAPATSPGSGGPGSASAGSGAPLGPGRLIGDASDARRVLLVVIVGDRGLSGGYNSFALRAADRLIRDGQAAGREYRTVAVGRKAQAYFRFRGRELDRVFTQMTDRPSFADARRVAGAVVRPFLAGEADLVQLVSWRFRSAGLQTVETRQLLPLPPEAAVPRSPGEDRDRPAQLGSVGAGAGAGFGGAAGGGAGRTPDAADPGGGPALPGGGRAGDVQPVGPPGPIGADGRRLGASYEFEPDPVELLGLLVPQYAEAELFRALLEASASEHTARQRAMAAATENADELITTYRRQMNRARQESITTEIMEIVGGAEALRQAGQQIREMEFEPSRPVSERSA